MTATPLFHVGFLVADIEQAMRDFSTLLDVTFNEPQLVQLNHLEDPGAHPIEFRVTFSKEGPVHYELLEAQGDGLFSLGHGEGMHHVAVWSGDGEAKMQELAALGYRSDARVIMPSGKVLSWFNDPDDAHGVRVEFIDEIDRVKLEHFMKTGEVEGGFVV